MSLVSPVMHINTDISFNMLTRLNAFSFILGSMYVYENIYQTVNMLLGQDLLLLEGRNKRLQIFETDFSQLLSSQYLKSRLVFRPVQINSAQVP